MKPLLAGIILLLSVAWPLLAFAGEGAEEEGVDPAEEGERGSDYWQNLTREDGEEKKPETKKEPKEKPFVYQLPHDPVPNVEYFSLRVGGGLYGYGGEAGLFSLRWKRIYWDVFKFNMYFGGPGLGGTLIRGNYGFLSGLGYPFSIGNHELRVGGGVGYQNFLSGAYNDGCLEKNRNNYGYKDCLLEKVTAYGTPPTGGAGGKIEFLYIYHFKERFALEAGLGVYFQIWPVAPVNGRDNGQLIFMDDTPKKVKYLYPDPSPVLTVGFRI